MPSNGVASIPVQLERSCRSKTSRGVWKNRGDCAKMTSDGMKKAEAFASECQMEPGKTRVENSELDKLDMRSLFIRLRWVG